MTTIDILFLEDVKSHEGTRADNQYTHALHRVHYFKSQDLFIQFIMDQDVN